MHYLRYYLLILGAGMIGFGFRLIYRQIAFILRSQKTSGKLNGWIEVPNLHSTEVYYYAEVAFQASDGTEHRVKSNAGSSPKPKTPIGRVIPVRYDPSNPNVAQFDTLFQLWSAPVAFLLLGGAATAVFFHLLPGS